jgi:hypothetical protein
MNAEDLKEAGAQELQILKGMVLAWKEDYCRSASPGGGGEHLCQDFSYEIEEYVYPYVRRMIVTEHIDQTQASEFLEFCSQQVLELRDYLLKEVEVLTI